MASKPANIFPENFRNIITSTFGVYTFQIVLVQMLQISPTEDTEAPLTLPESVLHPNELETFTKYKFPKRKNEFLTGRYCAKEAIIKLLPNTNNRIVDITMRDIEINANSDGRPAICIHTHTNVLPIDISIAHSKQYGTAVAAPKYVA